MGLFNAITAANRAEIVRTQATRWLEWHRPSLTPEQISAAEAAIAVITPQLYALETEAERVAVTRAVLDRLMVLFTREEVWRFLGAGAPFLPARS